MSIMRRTISTIVFTALLCTTVLGDVVVFKNGDKLSGKLVKLENGTLVFDSAEMGPINLKIERIRNFSTDADIECHFSDGTIIKSKAVTAEPGRFTLEKTDLLAAQTFSIDSLTAINPPAKPLPKWSGNVTVGISSTHGNAFSEGANVSFDTKRRSEKDRTHIYSRYLASRTKDKEENKKITTEESFLLGGKYDYFLTDKLYGYTNGSFKKDHVADLDHRIIAGLGCGYQWIETDDMNFGTDAGYANLYEKYTHRDSSTGLKKTTSTDEPSLQLGYSFDWKIINKITFLHNMRYFPSFGTMSDYFLTTNAELRASISKSMFGSFKAVLDYDSSPAENIGATDTKYILSIGWNF